MNCESSEEIIDDKIQERRNPPIIGDFNILIISTNTGTPFTGLTTTDVAQIPISTQGTQTSIIKIGCRHTEN